MGIEEPSRCGYRRWSAYFPHESSSEPRSGDFDGNLGESLAVVRDFRLQVWNPLLVRSIRRQPQTR